MKTITKISSICALVAGLASSFGCATVSGTILGPLTMPAGVSEMFENTTGHNKPVTAVATIVTLPASVISGAVCGFAFGASEDVYALKKGHYHEQWQPAAPWLRYWPNERKEY